ncbi:MAG: Mur ligase family protein, partial [Hyphomicrobium sp.]
MTPLWTSADLTKALRVEPEGEAGVPVTGVSIDTRTLQPGDLFVALRDQRDGHEFVAAAFKAGAAAALVGRNYSRQIGDGILFRTSDPLDGLVALGRAARERLSPDARVVAVTGSAGKTGTKEMLRACLSRLGATHASEKSYNNHWGVPLTLARMP